MINVTKNFRTFANGFARGAGSATGYVEDKLANIDAKGTMALVAISVVACLLWAFPWMWIFSISYLEAVVYHAIFATALGLITPIFVR